jgi:hypothetical protein
MPLYAQHYRGTLLTPQEAYEYNRIGVNTDEQNTIQDLQKRCQKLEDALKEMQLNMSIYDPQLMVNRVNEIDDTRKVLNTAINKLYETEHRLTKAEETIDVLNLRLLALEVPARKPKAPVSKPTSGFIPDTPATTPHPASKKSDASKPKAPVNKPKLAVKEGTAGGPDIK